MSAITIHCPLCNGALQIDASAAGQQVHCPLCQGLLQLPPWEALTGMPQEGFPPPPPPPAFAPPPQFAPPPVEAFGYPPPVTDSPPIPQGIPMGLPVQQAVSPALDPSLQPNLPPTSPAATPTGSIPTGTIPVGSSPPTPAAVKEPPPVLVMGCPACSKPFQVKRTYAEQVIRCPRCSREMTLPRLETLTSMLRAMRGDFPVAVLVEKKKSPAADKPATSERTIEKSKSTQPPAVPPARSAPSKSVSQAEPAGPVVEPRELQSQAISLPSSLPPAPPAPLPSQPPSELPAELPAVSAPLAPAAEQPVTKPAEPSLDLPAAAEPKPLPPTTEQPILPPSLEAVLPVAAEPGPATQPIGSKPDKSKRIAEMLPPGASAAPELPPAAESLPSAAVSTTADVLLPPGAVDAGVVLPGEERALPQKEQSDSGLPKPVVPKAPPGTVVLPAGDGRFVTVRDNVKVIGKGADEIELRRLTDAEKTRRRFIRNFIFAMISLAIIGITFYVMMSRSG